MALFEITDETMEEIKAEVKASLKELAEELSRELAINRDYLSFNEVMKYYSVSRNTLKNVWIEQYSLPVYVIGSKQYISRKDLHELFQQNKV